MLVLAMQFSRAGEVAGLISVINQVVASRRGGGRAHAPSNRKRRRIAFRVLSKEAEAYD